VLAVFLWRNREAIAEHTLRANKRSSGCVEAGSTRLDRQDDGIVAVWFGALGVAAIALAVFAGLSFA